MNISTRYARLLQRRAPIEERAIKGFSEGYEKESGENTKYLLGALKPIEKAFTERLIEQGNRVENQIKNRLKEEYPSLDFRRQGSVSNDTHIKHYSDVDVLVIIDKYIALERPQVPSSPYMGDTIADLIRLRAVCVKELGLAFPKVEIDDTGAKSISLKGGSLACKVDVVPSNWLNTNRYSETKQEHERGIEVLDKPNRVRNPNFPFLFNYRIDIHDNQRRGIARMLIRILKTIKADTEEDGKAVEFSSYDICSLIYRMPDAYFLALNKPAVISVESPLEIINNLIRWMDFSTANESVKSSLKVVDDSRLIFDKPEKVKGVAVLRNELYEIYEGAVKEHGTVFFTKSHTRNGIGATQ